MERENLLPHGGEGGGEDQDALPPSLCLRLNHFTPSIQKFVLLYALLISCAVNAFLTVFILSKERPSLHNGPTFGKCVQLVPDLLETLRTFLESSYPIIDAPVAVPSSFGSVENVTQTDAVWWSLDTSRGFVALDKTQPNLKLSETFPWDESKSIYLANAFHGLHCLVRFNLR
jgi:hypothetical protein